jgi:hypothetical protein
MCAVSPVVHASNISSCQKKIFSFPLAVNNSIKVGPFGFLVINVCNHGEHYETPCIKRFQANLIPVYANSESFNEVKQTKRNLHMP